MGNTGWAQWLLCVVRCVLSQMVSLYSDLIFLENNIPLPLVFFNICLHNSSSRLCLWLSQQLWILTTMFACHMKMHFGHKMTGRSISCISWQALLASPSYMHPWILQQLYLDEYRSKWVGSKDLFMCSVAFVATQNILLKAQIYSGTF